MDRLNVAYIMSDNPNNPKQVGDRYLRRSQTLMETFFARPIGKYDVGYVNTLVGLVADLAERSRRTGKRVGNLTIFVHGARSQDQPGVFWVRLPIAFDTENVTREDAFAQVNTLVRNSARYAKYERDFDYLHSRGVDDQTTVAFVGCLFGRNQQVLDAFRALFGGQPTVMAPRHRYVVNDWTGVRGTNQIGALFDRMTGEGLLPPARDSTRQGLLQALATRLQQVESVPANASERILGAPSLLARRVVPHGYLQRALSGDPVESRIRTNEQDVLRDWGVSTPGTDLERAVEAYTNPRSPHADRYRTEPERAALRRELRRLLLQQRLQDVFPGWGRELPVAPTAPARPPQGGLFSRLGALLASASPTAIGAPSNALVAPPPWTRPAFRCGTFVRTPPPIFKLPKPAPWPRAGTWSSRPPSAPRPKPLRETLSKLAWPRRWPPDRGTRPPIGPPPRPPKVGGHNPFEWGPGPTRWPPKIPGAASGASSSVSLASGKLLAQRDFDAIHVVRSGECLSRIARQHGSTVAALTRQNPWLLGRQGRILKGIDYILPGDRIRIGGGPAGPASFRTSPSLLATLGRGLR